MRVGIHLDSAETRAVLTAISAAIGEGALTGRALDLAESIVESVDLAARVFDANEYAAEGIGEAIDRARAAIYDRREFARR